MLLPTFFVNNTCLLFCERVTFTPLYNPRPVIRQTLTWYGGDENGSSRLHRR